MCLVWGVTRDLAQGDLQGSHTLPCLTEILTSPSLHDDKLDPGALVHVDQFGLPDEAHRLFRLAQSTLAVSHDREVGSVPGHASKGSVLVEGDRELIRGIGRFGQGLANQGQARTPTLRRLGMAQRQGRVAVHEITRSEQVLTDELGSFG